VPYARSRALAVGGTAWRPHLLPPYGHAASRNSPEDKRPAPPHMLQHRRRHQPLSTLVVRRPPPTAPPHHDAIPAPPPVATVSTTPPRLGADHAITLPPRRRLPRMARATAGGTIETSPSARR